MKAKINTTSNYRNLNGQILEVKEIVGTRVSCKFTDEFERDLTIDFGKSEVEIVQTEFEKEYLQDKKECEYIHMTWWNSLSQRKRWELFFKYNPVIANLPLNIELNLNGVPKKHILEMYNYEILGLELPKPEPTKIYIVKSYFGRWEDSYETIDGTFFTEQEAKDLLARIEKDIEKLKALDLTIDYNDESTNNWHKYSHLFDFLRADFCCYNYSRIETLTVGETCANYYETYSTAKEVMEEDEE